MPRVTSVHIAEYKPLMTHYLRRWPILTAPARALALAFTILLPLGARAQQARPAIEGDVYLTMQSGDIRKIAANTVLAIPAGAFAAARKEVCAPRRAFIDSLAARVARNKALVDSLQKVGKEQPLAEMRRAGDDEIHLLFLNDTLSTPIAQRLGAVATARAALGLQAHYRFDSLPAGEYILHVATRIGNRDYYWAQPATVAAKPVTLDLDNTNVHQLTLGCADVF